MESGKTVSGLFLVDVASNVGRVLRALLILPGIGILAWDWFLLAGNPIRTGKDLLGFGFFLLLGLTMIAAAVFAFFAKTGVKLTGFRFEDRQVKYGVGFSKADALDIANIRDYFEGSIEDYECAWQEKENVADSSAALTVTAVIAEIPFIRSAAIEGRDQKLRSVGTGGNLRNNLAVVIDGRVLLFNAPLMTRFEQLDRLLKSRPDIRFACTVLFEGDLGNVSQAGLMYGVVGAAVQGAYNELVKQPRAEREAGGTFAGLIASYGWKAPQLEKPPSR